MIITIDACNNNIQLKRLISSYYALLIIPTYTLSHPPLSYQSSSENRTDDTVLISCTVARIWQQYHRVLSAGISLRYNIERYPSVQEAPFCVAILSMLFIASLHTATRIRIANTLRLKRSLVDNLATAQIISCLPPIQTTKSFTIRNVPWQHPDKVLTKWLLRPGHVEGMWRGSEDEFRRWVESVRNLMITNYGLDKTYEVQPITEFTQFHDIQYKFEGGRLTTDLFRKPTDANRYLEFTS